MDRGSDDAPGRPALRYRDAGVDIAAQERALRGIARLVASTRIPGVLSELGSFGGLFAPDLGETERPVLVASADGVGTKLRIAFESGIHDTVGRDLVNHCVNDILVHGARPLFFLDYVAAGRLHPEVIVAVVEGIARGCREAGCALLGGETAEMPGFYAEGEYDVAGFIVGIVDRARLLDGSRIEDGNLLVGLPSAGLHTNGYSLARKILFEVAGLSVGDRIERLEATVAQLLLAEHRSYLPALREPLARGWIRGLAHITGGGITDNLARPLPEGLAARVERDGWEVPELFRYLQEQGNVPDEEMLRAFNMGIGMIVVLDPTDAARLETYLDDLGETHMRIGRIVRGDRTVHYA